ncbi:MAG: helix-turn-helix domain-containing protein [Pseudomonadota bacterium]
MDNRTNEHANSRLDEAPRLNETELARLLNLSKRTLQGWRLKGGGPTYEKQGRAVRYSKTAVAAWLAECERSSTSANDPVSVWGILQAPTPSEIRGGKLS